MKKVFLVVAAVTAVTGFSAMPANAAQTKVNAGLVSNHVVRGAAASDDKAAAQGVLDLTAGAFYAGTWLSSVEVANTINVNGVGPESGEIVSGGDKTLEDRGIEVDPYAGLAGYADRDLIVNDQSNNTLIFGVTKDFSILQ